MALLRGSPEAAEQLRKMLINCYEQVINQYVALETELRKIQSDGQDSNIDQSVAVMYGIRNELVEVREPLQQVITRLRAYQEFLEQLDVAEQNHTTPTSYGEPNGDRNTGRNGGTSNVRAKSIVSDYGFSFTQGITERMQMAPEAVRTAWNRFAGDFRVGSADSNDAYFSPATMAVYLDIAASAAGNAWSEPYNTVFHEHGHNIDHLLNQAYGTGNPAFAYSVTFEGGSFAVMLRQEAQEAVADFAQKHGLSGLPYGSICEAFADEMRNTFTLMELADISDMFEPYLDIDYPMGTGHGLSYWNHVNPAEEAFAEMFAANVAGSTSLVQIKRFFPRSYAIFERMLGVIQ